MDLQTLSVEDVSRIHERVSRDFENTDDPVGGAGPRDSGALLESAVSRQHVGLGPTLKYPDAYENAATLTFGLCCGHPFHNGNKRTALVSMLAHLDKNGLTIIGVRQKELYRMIKAVATHSLGVRVPRRSRAKTDYTKREADVEVSSIADWLRANGRALKRGEKHITHRELRKILARLGLSMENPRNNKIGIYREETHTVLFKKRTVKRKISTIGYPGDGKMVHVGTIKRLRKECGLSESDGCDAAVFYEGADPIDAFINEYRSILSKLARE